MMVLQIYNILSLQMAQKSLKTGQETLDLLRGVHLLIIMAHFTIAYLRFIRLRLAYETPVLVSIQAILKLRN